MRLLLLLLLLLLLPLLDSIVNYFSRS